LDVSDTFAETDAPSKLPICHCLYKID